MSNTCKEYSWQKIKVLPNNVTAILDQMENLETLLDCENTDLEEQLAIHEELSRLNGMWLAAFEAEMSERLGAAAKLSSQHANSSQPSFHQTSYEFRGIIWLTVFGLLIMFPIIPFLNKDLPCMFPMWFGFFLLDIVWAIWASNP